MVEERDPHVVDEALTDPRRVPPLEQAQGRGGQGHAHRRECEPEDQGLVLGPDRVVEQGPEEERRHDAHPGREHHADEEADERAPVRAGEAEDAADEGTLDPLAAHRVGIPSESHEGLVHLHGDAPT